MQTPIPSEQKEAYLIWWRRGRSFRTETGWRYCTSWRQLNRHSTTSKPAWFKALSA